MLLAACLTVAACGSPAEPADDLPLHLFAYDRNAPLAFQALEHVSPIPTLQLYAVTFASPGGGSVTGWMAVPTAAGPFAGIVLLHGLPGTAQGAMSSQGLDLATRGAVVLAIDAPWARRGGAPDLTVRDSVEQVQLMMDLQRAVDVLAQRPDVDTARMGYVGGSYGGAMGASFAGIERRLKAYALFVPDGGLVAHFTDDAGAPQSPLADLPAGQQERWLAAMRPIEPIRFVHRAPPAALLIQSGRLDALVDPDDAAALHAAARPPLTVLWYDAGHGLDAQARGDRLAWLAARLGTAP